MILRPIYIFTFVILMLGINGCNDDVINEEVITSKLEPACDYNEKLFTAHSVLDSAIIDDFFSPPVASRIYVYPFLVMSEIQNHQNGKVLLLDSTQLGNIIIDAKTNGKMSSIFAFYLVAKELVYSSHIIEEGLSQYELSLSKAGYNADFVKQSKAIAQQFADGVLALAKTDGYLKTRSMSIYEPKTEEGKWKPTLPDYSNALEPHWNTLKPIWLDSASQFLCAEPPAYSLDPSSDFYKELIEVKNIAQDIDPDTDDRFQAAKFWDCNPFVPMHQGHVTIAEKKLTPGGHWLRIAKAAMNEQQLDFKQRIIIYAALSTGIYDGFISCWDAKYHYDYIRPITVIREELDPNWSISLYTPNFPEYPSGHSVISGISSTILTELIGENYSFVDSSEFAFGMQPRSFNSFYEARDEAVISRLNGGIHFRSAVELGADQGNKIGEYVLKKLQ